LPNPRWVFLTLCTLERFKLIISFAQKLQELLRRGTPADLAAANDLMKVMAGYVCAPLERFDTGAHDVHDDRILKNGQTMTKKWIAILTKSRRRLLSCVKYAKPPVQTLGILIWR
jgi:hypothetical protein